MECDQETDNSLEENHKGDKLQVHTAEGVSLESVVINYG